MTSATHLPIRISDLLNNNIVENERIEFKEGWNPEAILRTICAFANDLENLGGGYIVVGVAEKNGQPVLPPTGIIRSTFDAIQKELLGICNLLQPHYFPQVALESLHQKSVLVIWCPGGNHRPYTVPAFLHSKENKTRNYYIRRFSSTVVASGDTLNELISLTAKVPFDDRAHPTATIDDLSITHVVAFLDSVGSALASEIPKLSKEEIFNRMQVLEGPPEHRRVRNIALLMFANEPRKFIPYAQIDVVWFPNGAGADEFEEQIFTGTLTQQLRGALEYIFGKISSEKVVKYPDRAEAGRYWSYPKVAIEEALANAVYHRNYELREPIEVRIFPTEILIYSVNGPDSRISMESLLSGRAIVRTYRNRRIGEFLKELKFTEGRNTGIAKIRDSLSKNGSQPPVFHSDDARTYFVTEFKIHSAFVEIQSAADFHSLELYSKVETLAHVGTPHLSDMQLKILIFCQHVPHSNAEILAHVGAHDRTGSITRALSSLSSQGLLALTIPDKPKSKNQKRVTTALGKDVVKNRSELTGKNDQSYDAKEEK